jgi:hypothetical protein
MPLMLSPANGMQNVWVLPSGNCNTSPPWFWLPLLCARTTVEAPLKRSDKASMAVAKWRIYLGNTTQLHLVILSEAKNLRCLLERQVGILETL